jgi:hypothetical protein
MKFIYNPTPHPFLRTLRDSKFDRLGHLHPLPRAAFAHTAMWEPSVSVLHPPPPVSLVAQARPLSRREPPSTNTSPSPLPLLPLSPLLGLLGLLGLDGSWCKGL